MIALNVASFRYFLLQNGNNLITIQIKPSYYSRDVFILIKKKRYTCKTYEIWITKNYLMKSDKRGPP